MMYDFIRNITWKQERMDLQSQLELLNPGNITPMKFGQEAEVYRIHTSGADLVLKVWNRDSRPDISIQYNMLESLYNRGIAVSKPYGWGVDENKIQVLLTSYDGTPVDQVNNETIIYIAKRLIEIHNLPQGELGSSQLPSYDFIGYFYPGVDNHTDIKDLLIELVGSTNMEQKCLIHGDYHLDNIVESGGKYTIIDWTNVQLGDPRYDIAWSSILIWIYVSERYYSIYRAAFLANNTYTAEEQEKFEAIACLRWILLNRIADLPMRPNTVNAVKSLLMKNKYLVEGLL
jgi:thiamine kinase-like enzyme